MATYHTTIALKTKGNCDIIDITRDVEKCIAGSGLKTGLCNVFCAGSTGSVTTIEFEGGLLKDFPAAMERIAPSDAVYEHHLRWQDGNGHSHIRASILGPSLTIPFADARPCLGTWQQVVFVDFDNVSRNRLLEVVMVGE
ncbi:MAG: secondary thiamine-phosphate synthase enzyme [Candidatus Thorarchaeota archaeon]|nr:MAG: secondary thiamine-phosphate synthase enzyme [Candidatus Thorarchaeota archaeon]